MKTIVLGPAGKMGRAMVARAFESPDKVIFGFENERLGLAAHGYNTGTYADGMIAAGRFLVRKNPGCYALIDKKRVGAGTNR